MTNHATPNAPPLSRDERGAIMVIGVFMAIVLVGLLYYMSGLGQLLFRRERMQDAADAVALATAIGHARGMNLIVFINMVMAALVAIVLALKIIELMLTGLALILVAISWFVPPAGAAVPIVYNAREIVKDVHDAAREIVDNILIGLNMAERAIRVITPVQSVLTATIKVGEKYGDVTDLVVGVPPRLTLPVENDKYDTLCNEGGKIISDLIHSVTGGIPFVGKVIDLAAEVLIGAVKNAYCFKDGSEIPPTPIPFDRVMPNNATGQACEDDKAAMNAGSQNCSDWEKELRDRHPEKSDGNCPSSGDRATVCNNALSAARDQCNINNPGNKSENYSWATQSVKETVVFDTQKWDWKTIKYEYVGEPVLFNTTDYGSAMDTYTQAMSEVNSGNRPNFDQIEQETPRTGGKPCDNGGARREDSLQPELLWSEWNPEATWPEITWTAAPGQSEPEKVQPVCTKKLAAMKDKLPSPIPERTLDGKPPPGFEGEFDLPEYDTVKQVYGCTVHDDLPVVFPKEWASQGSSGGDDKAPQKMEEGAALGSGDFQIRGFALLLDGELRSKKVDKQLGHAAFERQIESEEWVTLARNSGRIMVSQAEYYFNHDGVTYEKVYDWMWHMDWRARLVRFRLPGDDEDQNDSRKQPDMDVASLVSDSDTVGVDLSSVPTPPGAPSLDVLENLLTH